MTILNTVKVRTLLFKNLIFFISYILNLIVCVFYVIKKIKNNNNNRIADIQAVPFSLSLRRFCHVALS